MPSTEAGVENSANKRADADGRSYLKESLGAAGRENSVACSAFWIYFPLVRVKEVIMNRSKFLYKATVFAMICAAMEAAGRSQGLTTTDPSEAIEGSRDSKLAKI